MHHRSRVLGTLAALLLAAALGACGSSSSGQATSLLKQTFSGKHTVNSGELSFSLMVNPSGSSTLRGPISLSFGGPFQSLGQGKLPKSDFNISFSAQGTSGTIGLKSTGTTGYVTLKGTSYQLPAATFQRLESSFAQLASSPGGGSGSGTLSKLGINPLHWLTNPSVVGTESVGGADTTHIKAGVDVSKLLADLNTFLERASSLGASGTGKLPTSISETTRNRIASEIQNPSFDVWTGNGDKTVRKLLIKLTLPVSGQISTLLGGLRSAQIALTMQYANLNQPQTIAAPTSVRPFSEFAAKLRSFLASLEGSLGGAASAGSAGSGTSAVAPTTTTTGGSSGASNSTIQRYSRCIVNAHNDVSKMQRCASIVNGG